MGGENTTAGGPAVTSLFVLDNIPEQMCFASPLWDEIPISGQFSWGEGGSLSFRLAHDILNLYLRIEGVEPGGEALRAGRISQVGRLYLDDAVEISLAPPWTSGGRWLLRVNPKGVTEWIGPEGAPMTPEPRIENAVSEGSWRLFLALPFVDLFSGDEAAGTPVSGDRWGFNVGRLLPGSASAARWAGGGGIASPEWLGSLEFDSGPTRQRARLDSYAEPNFGVNTVKFDVETSVKDGALAAMEPAPAERLRTRTKAHMRFRAAKPGSYRLWVDLAEEPAPEPEEEFSEEELTDEEFEQQEPARGESASRYGVTFRLPDIWRELERMEDHVTGLKGRLDAAGIEPPPELAASLGFFDGTLIRVDRFRSPNVREALSEDLWGQFSTLYDKSVSGMRGLLIQAGQLHVLNPYSEGGEWHKAALHVTPQEIPATELVGRLRQAGYRVFGMVQPYAGGRVGELDPALAESADTVSLAGVEAGEHVRFVSLGLPPGELEAGEYSYAFIERASEAGGVSFLAASQEDVFPLPAEAKGLIGIEANMRLWDRYLGEVISGVWFLQGGDIPDTPDTPGGEGSKERFNMILAREFSRQGVLDALRRGSFYATTGPIISSVEVSGATVTVRSEEPAHITFVGKGGEVLSGAMGKEASFTFDGLQEYVRASVLADVDADGFRREALTQPFPLSPDVPAEAPDAEAEETEEAALLDEEEPEAVAPRVADPSLPVGAVTAVLDDFIQDDDDEEPDSEPGAHADETRGQPDPPPGASRGGGESNDSGQAAGPIGE